MKYLYVGVLLTLASLAYGQSDQAEYLEAKRLYELGDFASAESSFDLLRESSIFGTYSTFYFGICAYNQGDTAVALDTWSTLLDNNPRWSQRRELFYWLAKVNFEKQNYEMGIDYAQKLTNETLQSRNEEQFIETYIEPLSLNRVSVLHQRFPENQLLASILVAKLSRVKYTERDFLMIDSLVAAFNLNLSELLSDQLPEVRKEAYDVAVVMPFLFESLDNTALISQNKFVMDMYQGMLLAAEDLTQKGYPINLYPHDTKRRKDVTDQLLSVKGFANYDLMIGPLFPGPIAAADTFSMNNQLNRFNPISSNSDALGENPFSFLIRPTYETMAKATAALAVAENENPYAMVFFERSDRDSTFAVRYKEMVEEAGIEVLLFQAITQENSKELLDGLWSQYDSYMKESVADSIMTADPLRFIKSRRVRRDELKRMDSDESFKLPISYDEDENQIVYYEKLFNMAPDSIGHIVVATRSNLFANKLISAIETRGDSIKLYGYGDWLDFTMLSYSQLERLQVALSNPDFIDLESPSYQTLKEKFEKKYKAKPSINHFRGYETAYFTGMMMHKYGRYFQKELRNGAMSDGQVFQGYRYGSANDNQIVPIIRFINTKLEVVNSEFYEIREK